MTSAPASLVARFDDLSEVGRERVGARYHGTARDGTVVEVWALSSATVAQMTEPARLDAVLARIAAMAPEGCARLVSWGAGEDGVVHVAYARGTPLQAEGRPAIGAAAPIARGLAVLHRAGLLHGAISTERIVQGATGAEVTAMGLYEALRAAGVAGRDASMALTAAPYASPEQQLGGVPDERSDVYSLGGAIYELLTGKPPFGGRTTSYVMAAVLGENDLDPDTPVTNPAQPGDPAVDAVLRAIERAPEDRWPSMEAFAAALAVGGATKRQAARRGCLPAVAAAGAMVSVAVLLAR